VQVDMVPLSLPQYLTRTTLLRAVQSLPSGVLNSQPDQWGENYPQRPALASPGLHIDWSAVVYFDDSTLLELILFEHQLLSAGLQVSHFSDKSHAKEPFKPHVLRQLEAAGYIKQWVSEDFGASRSERDRLSVLEPLQGDLTPLERRHEILSMVACHSADRLNRGSPEDSAIRQYEEEAAVNVFVYQGPGEMCRRPLIASGEFGQLVLRQCRRNVLEHAEKRTLALSLARIVRLSDIQTDWGLDPAAWRLGTNTSLSVKLHEWPDTPLLDMTTIDDGWGIPQSLGSTWKNNEEVQTKAFFRVSPIVKDWPSDGKIIEFALDPEGSRKPSEWRSKEEPGLSRINGIVEREGGSFEISSGSCTVIHQAETRARCQPLSWVLRHGCAVRMLVPLHERPAEGVFARRTGRSVVGRRFGDNSQEDMLCHLVSLREMWGHGQESRSEVVRPAEHHSVGFKTGSSPQRRLEGLTNELKLTLDALPTGTKVLVLDWSELPWGEHEASSFLDRVRTWVTDTAETTKPIVHANVPRELLMNARRAVRAYSDPPLPTCVFLEGGSWTWIGLDIAGDDCRLRSYVHPPMQSLSTGEIESYDEQYLRLLFDALLEGGNKGGIETFGFGFEGWLLARHYLGRATLFTEQKVRNSSEGGTRRPVFFHRLSVSKTCVESLPRPLPLN